jgi:predicted RNase H-like HicB family nuclease/predicted XRE-type DNA-binding protein
VVAQVKTSSESRYMVSMAQEDGIWLIEAVDLVGVRSFGRTVSDAVRNIREAIAAAEDLDEWEYLSLDYAFSDEVATDALREFHEADRAEENAAMERDRALRAVLESLRSQGMSYRDLATVIGISHQRVAQLLADSRV